MKKVLIVLCLALFAVGSVACSGGGGGGGEIDLTGTWNWSRRITSEVCDWRVQVGQTIAGTLVVNQDGNRLVVRDRTGLGYEGTINGDMVAITFTDFDVAWNFNGTVLDNNNVRLNGSASQISGPCRLEFSEDWTRVSNTLLF